MAKVELKMITLLLHALALATSESPEQSRSATLRPTMPLAFQMVQRHLNNLMQSPDAQVEARRLVRARTLPDWFVDKDDCYIQYCNQYQVLQNASCCPAGEQNGFLCGKIPHCSASDSEQVNRCKFQTIAMFQNAQDEAQMKRHVFSSDCGGISLQESTAHRQHGSTFFEPKAAWECAFPDGTCSDDRPVEIGLPHKVQNCVTAKNEGPLTVKFTIDLFCLGIQTKFTCDSSLSNETFDPFPTCKNDQDIVAAQCHFGCKHGFPYEYCSFGFDPRREFMNDTTIGKCSLHQECRSPYVGSNTIFCSRDHEATQSLPNMNLTSSVRGRSPAPNLESTFSHKVGQSLLNNLPILIAVSLLLVLCASMLSLWLANAKARGKGIHSLSPVGDVICVEPPSPPVHDKTKQELEMIGVPAELKLSPIYDDTKLEPAIGDETYGVTTV